MVFWTKEGANKTPSRKDTSSDFQPNCWSKILEWSFIHFDTKTHLLFGARPSKWASFRWRISSAIIVFLIFFMVFFWFVKESDTKWPNFSNSSLRNDVQPTFSRGTPKISLRTLVCELCKMMSVKQYAILYGSRVILRTLFKAIGVLAMVVAISGMIMFVRNGEWEPCWLVFGCMSMADSVSQVSHLVTSHPFLTECDA